MKSAPMPVRSLNSTNASAPPTHAAPSAETSPGAATGEPAQRQQLVPGLKPQRPSSPHSGPAPRQAATAARQKLEQLGNPREQPAARPLDVLYVGDGLSARYTAAFVMDTRAQLPEDERSNPLDEEGHLRMMMIGPTATSGVGRAYTQGRGYAGGEQVNLLARQMQFTRALPTPIDAALLRHAPDLDDRVRGNLRPFDFGKDITQNGLTYTLKSDRRNSYSLEDFNRSTNPQAPPDTLTRETFGRYVAHCVDRALSKSDRVHLDGVDGEVFKVRYDEALALFEVSARRNDGEVFTVQARNVVLATGHHPEHVPRFLQKVAGAPNVHTGEAIFRFLQSVPEQAEALKGKRGLVVGTGLTMNDVAVSLHDHDVESFVAVSRSGHTHELPLAVPEEEVDAIPRLDEALEALHDLLDLHDIRNEARNAPGEQESLPHVMSSQMKLHLEAARHLVDQYMQAYHDEPETDKSPMVIRGQEFDRERVIRALLSQYVAFRYENLRSQPLRDMFGSNAAREIVKRTLREIDFNPEHASWLTTSRTSTTDRNILANRRLREQGRLSADEIMDVDPLPGGQLSVKFASGRTEEFDYIVNASGRLPVPGDPKQLPDTPVINSVVEAGLVRRDSAGLGLAIDRHGRALPEPGRLQGDRPASIYPVAPSLSKMELLFPQSLARPGLNNVVAESVMGLRPLLRQAADEIILNIYGKDVDLPWRDDELDFIYEEDAVDTDLR
jgi:uncharacterized NAD(P)/FAD-binding protein YdhS